MIPTLEGIQLPEDIQWEDEFSGFGVGQVITPTLTGALIVEEFGQTAGRPITLTGDGHSWVYRSTVEALSTLVATPLSNQTLTLVWADGRSFDVVFDRSRNNGLKAQEVQRMAASIQTTEHYYTIEINLLTA